MRGRDHEHTIPTGRKISVAAYEVAPYGGRRGRERGKNRRAGGEGPEAEAGRRQRKREWARQGASSNGAALRGTSPRRATDFLISIPKGEVTCPHTHRRDRNGVRPTPGLGRTSPKIGGIKTTSKYSEK